MDKGVNAGSSTFFSLFYFPGAFSTSRAASLVCGVCWASGCGRARGWMVGRLIRERGGAVALISCVGFCHEHMHSLS